MEPTLFLKRSCPHCLRAFIFLVESGISDQVNLTVFDHGSDMHARLRADMSDAGIRPSFPALQDGDAGWTADSGEIIAHLAHRFEQRPMDSGLLHYYENGLYNRYQEMRQENRALKEKLAGLES
jgi:glutathione S-transferase